MQDKEQFNFKKFFLRFFIVIAIFVFFHILSTVLSNLLSSNPDIFGVCNYYSKRGGRGGAEPLPLYYKTNYKIQLYCYNIYGISIPEDIFIWLLRYCTVVATLLASILIFRVVDGKETLSIPKKILSEDFKKIGTKGVLLRISVVISLFFLSVFFTPFFSSDYPILGFFFPLIFTSLGSFFIFKQINKESKKVDKKSN